ncbi:MAG: hypothetical protein U0894_18950 [Pirellulales bacterium]
MTSKLASGGRNRQVDDLQRRFMLLVNGVAYYVAAYKSKSDWSN